MANKMVMQYRVVLRDYFSNVKEMAVFQDRSAAVSLKEEWAKKPNSAVSLTAEMALAPVREHGLRDFLKFLHR